MQYRSHVNGEFRLQHVGLNVTLVGWVQRKRNLGSLLFIDLRDRSGIVQLFVKDPSLVPDVKQEYLIQVKGIVTKKDVANKALATGEVEIDVNSLTIINTAETLPLIVDDVTDAGEDIRLTYRYLDLRRQPMQQTLRRRSHIMNVFHSFFAQEGFVNIETPLLTLSTPGGARDFLVPSRIHPGSFYALPQSPQIYKQLLMIGGFDRYYQIARCFRDEDLRADRQPDFTQIDVEAAFLTQDEFLGHMENVIARVFKDVQGVDILRPFARLRYEDAMEQYGSDKPDLRFQLPIQRVPQSILDAYQKANFEATHVRALVLPQGLLSVTRKVFDEWTTFVKPLGLKGLVVLKHEGDQLTGSFAKFIEASPMSVFESLGMKPGDVVLLASHASRMTLLSILGLLRLKAAHVLQLAMSPTPAICWITDFPLFDRNEKGQLVSAHHPFTRPRDEDLSFLKSSPDKVIAQAYDLVINGNEAGGGSMRIYDRDIQKTIFELLGLTEQEIQQKFGWFIQAFNYGTPPHGGIAFGLDRLTMILSGTDNIKDVIAFPKNLKMVGLLEGTPNTVEPSQLSDLHVEVNHEE
jgi:aspartyl-tRNA synthetase